jgi:hypothetical protein
MGVSVEAQKHIKSVLAQKLDSWTIDETAVRRQRISYLFLRSPFFFLDMGNGLNNCVKGQEWLATRKIDRAAIGKIRIKKIDSFCYLVYWELLSPFFFWKQ